MARRPGDGAARARPPAAAAELLADRADGLLALDPAVDVDLDEAMALVRTLADAAGRAGRRPRGPAPGTGACCAADILPGDPAPWLAVERERFRQIRLNAMEELSAALSAAGRHADAVAVAEDAVRTAPSRESARRALIEAHLAQGEIAEAVAQYDEYQELLRSSVGAPFGSGLDGACGLEGLLPPVPAWPVLRVRRSMQRVGMAPPVRCAPRAAARAGSSPAARCPAPPADPPTRRGVTAPGLGTCSPCMRSRTPPNPTSRSTRTSPAPGRPAASADGHPADRAEGDAPGTTGTGEGEEFVGRAAGRDLGYAGETGAEARAQAGEKNP